MPIICFHTEALGNHPARKVSHSLHYPIDVTIVLVVYTTSHMLEGESSFATKYKTELQNSGGQERVGGGAGGQEKGAGRRGGAFAQKNAMLFIIVCCVWAPGNPKSNFKGIFVGTSDRFGRG